MKEKRNSECKELSRRYAAGEMTASEMKSFELHLAGCQDCKTFVSEWNGLFASLSASAVKASIDPGPDFDLPVMAFVRSMLEARAAAVAQAEAWAGARGADLAALGRATATEGAALGTATATGATGPAAATIPAPRSLWAAALHSRLAWACGAGAVVALVFLGVVIRGLTIVLPSGERQYVNAVTWLVHVLDKGFDWMVFHFMRSLKIGEVFVQIGRALDPLWSSFGVAARNIDPQFITIQLLLFMLSLVLLRAVVVARASMGTARKGRCPHVEIML